MRVLAAFVRQPCFSQKRNVSLKLSSHLKRMCSKEVKDNPHCLVCSSRVGVSTRNSVQIFSKEAETCSDRPLSFIMSQVLGLDVKEETVHSLLVCKKCFKLFDEVDELEQRLLEVKLELIGNYKKSVEKNKNGKKSVEKNKNGEDDLGEDETQCNEENKDCDKENQVPKKILDIPSSDDDTQQTTTEKTSLQTLEDIEMELVKIHGGIDKVDSPKSKLPEDIDDSSQPCHGFESHIIDDGAIDHASDSDYEPPGNDTPDALLEAAEIAEKNLEKVQIKIEPGMEDDKTHVMKRKMSHSRRFIPKRIKEEPLPPVVTREGNMYTCLLCEGDETVCGEAKAIMQHVKVAHDARLYICDVCGDDFRKRNELSMHLDEHVATEEGDFQCEVCNRIFSNLRLFRIHKRMHYPQNKAWTCETCGKRYSSKNLLEEHINTHTGVRPYICQLCGKDFASKYTFKAHEKTHEVRPRPFQSRADATSGRIPALKSTPATFVVSSNLTQHERTHSGVKEYACHLCEKQFGSLHNLEVHSIVHTGYKPYVCGQCGKAFARKAEIRDHERTHTGERPYQCEFCGATFSQRSNLQSHKRATHYDDKRYKCDHCGKGFKRRRLLDYHIKAVHTGERPFKCDVCEATFVYPEHFKKHRRIHTGEKPFLCEVCGKAFNSRDNRNAHRFVHSDKKPYECLVCGAGFMRKPLLYQHMQTQGHLNDTIVVNQPRLTTDDDQIITVNADGEMEIVDGDVSRLEQIDANDDDTVEDSKLYIADIKPHLVVDSSKVFGHSEGSLIVGEHMDDDQMEDTEAVEHIIINGQQIQFAEDDGDGEEMEEAEDGDGEGSQVLASAEDYEKLITSAALANGETQIIQTKDGPVQFVQVRIPNSNGEEEDAWLRIVPE
ncbi:Zinc finger, C2H2 type [Popillia japonica]|uniref:Zinc finger, C2H2 type n=1 Tax=Popillia japonica TaxID=7064 RepID=A0AAW1IXR2_POPJA